MSNETYAALIGAAVGGLATFFSTIFFDLKKNNETKRKAIVLFKFFHKQWEDAESHSRGGNSQKQAYTILLQLGLQIRGSIISCPCENIITTFLAYTATLHEINEHLQAGSNGLVHWPVSRIQGLYQEFTNHAAEENCCG